MPSTSRTSLAYIISEGLVDGAHIGEDEDTETHAYGFSMDDDK